MNRAHLTPTLDALRVFGQQLAVARRAQRQTTAEVAERAGISLPTLRKAERGDPGVSIGIMFDIATILGVPLFAATGRRLAELAASGERELALLPSRIDRPRTDVDNDF